MELKRNEEYTNLLEQWGYEVYLPQREAGLSAQILKDEKNDKLETLSARTNIPILSFFSELNSLIS